MPQFIKCRFSPVDARLYTYIDPEGDVVVGDFVKAPDARDPIAWKRVEVMEIGVAEPSFACKAILGKVTGRDTDSAILGHGTA